MNAPIDIRNYILGLTISELEETLFVFSESLDIPENRRKDPNWIIRNVSIRNSKNEMTSVVIEIAKSLVKRKNKK